MTKLYNPAEDERPSAVLPRPNEARVTNSAKPAKAKPSEVPPPASSKMPAGPTASHAILGNMTALQPAKKRARHFVWWAGGGLLLICAVVLALWGVSQIQIHRAERQQNLERAKQLQRARQAACRAFGEALAGVKVACAGATFEEFRQRQLALDAAFELYKADLPHELGSGEFFDYQKLHDLMWACEQCWQFPIRRAAAQAELKKAKKDLAATAGPGQEAAHFEAEEEYNDALGETLRISLETTPEQEAVQEANYARAFQILFPSATNEAGSLHYTTQAGTVITLEEMRFKPKASVRLALSAISDRCDVMLIMVRTP
jgi:hypothetical protein